MKNNTNSKRIKESRKPANKLDFEYWDASDALTERNLYCYDSSDATDYNFDGLIIYNKLNDRSSQVGCLILTPTSYYLAGPDESTCFEGNSYEEFIKDLDEMMEDIKTVAGKRSSSGFITEGKKRIKESASWEKKFEQKIKQRVVRIFQDWIDEDNAQGMVDDFDISPDNAVEDLIKSILENEADEIHEGRYEDFLYTIMDEEDINQKEIEKVGEAYLDKLEGLNIEEKRKTFGKSYCNKLEKQMQYVSAFGDEDEEHSEEPSDYEKYWKIEPEAIERFKERARELERRIVYNVHWRYMPYKESEKDEMYFEINYNFLEINCDGTGKIYKVHYYTGETETLATLEGIITAKDVDDAFDKYSEIINVEKYFRN